MQDFVIWEVVFKFIVATRVINLQIKCIIHEM